MKSIFTKMFVFLLIGLQACQPNQQQESSQGPGSADGDSYVMVIHGGAGTILKEQMTPEKEEAYRAGLEEALRTGYEILQQGGSSLDAVERTIHVLENNPLFNAGKGAVFTNQGKNELDASIMDGKSGLAGAVAGVTILKNPISAARAVMEKSEHVMMIGGGAEQFAIAQGLETVEPSYFYTEDRWKALQRALARDSARTTASYIEDLNHPSNTVAEAAYLDEKFGTVGCVALDQNGDLAAGTSTGGMTNKRYGRVGDAPIIGAGTFANNQVGVSCTGWGEFYIRQVVAYDIAAQMEYKQSNLADAAQATMDKVGAAGGNGGIIALDKNGNIAMPFNTAGMYRGAVTKDGRIEVAIFS